MAAWDIFMLQAVWWGVPQSVTAEVAYRAAMDAEAPNLQRTPEGTEAIGHIGNTQYRFQANGGRLDIFAEAAPTDRTSFPTLPYKEATESFFPRALKIAPIVPAPLRLAVVGLTVCNPGSPDAAADEVKRAASITGTFSDPRDLMVRLNIRKAVEKNVTLNRIVTLEAGFMMHFTQLAGMAVASAQEVPVAQCNVDINTVPVGRRTFSVEEQSKLLPIMFAECDRLSTERTFLALTQSR